MIMNISHKKMIDAAYKAMQSAYAPYSRFKVGAALLCCDSEKIYTGCNIENSSYGGTLCAERTASAKAVSDRMTKFVSIAIIGGFDGVITDFCYPCGICRQFLAEFALPDFTVVLSDNMNDITTIRFCDLLPHSFKLKPELT